VNNRRAFITLLGGAAGWPLAARAEQTAVQVVGFVHLTSVETNRENLATFRRGLEGTGYIEGKNLAIEYRWAQGRNDRFPALLTELVRRQVCVIVCTGEYEWCACSESGDPNDPDCFYARRRPGQDRPSR